MGCCSSRPDGPSAEDNSIPRTVPAPTRRATQTQQHAVTSETAINPTQSRTLRRRSTQPDPATSLRQSHDSSRSQSRSHISLAEHYNVPLLTPKSWASKSRKWNPASLRRERYEFFETRVTGRREIWDALRQVAECVRENDLSTAQGILDAIGVTLPTGRLEEGGYDEAGNLYRVPNAVLSDPTNIQPDDAEDGETDTMIGTVAPVDMKEATVGKLMEDEYKDDDVISATPTRDDKGKAPVEKDAIKIKCRLSDRGGPDVIIALGKSQNVGALTRLVRDEAEIPEHARLRVVYLGRMLDEKKSLHDQGWKEGQVLNVMVAGVFSD